MNWKLADAIHASKRAREEPSNYRPGSLTLVPGEITGKITL